MGRRHEKERIRILTSMLLFAIPRRQKDPAEFCDLWFDADAGGRSVAKKAKFPVYRGITVARVYGRVGNGSIKAIIKANFWRITRHNTSVILNTKKKR